MTKKSDAPAIRFKGFSDAWEQRKLSEITDKVTEKNAGLQYVETFTNSAEFGIISQRDFFDHDIAKLGSLDGYYIVKNEDFVYNPRISTSAPVGPINRNKLGRTGVMSPLYTVFRPHDIDTTYLEYFFKCGYWHSFMNFNGDSGARSDRFSIRDNVFFQMPIPIPDIDEQRKIGELLTCLDNLITLHQRKFEKLTNVKKSMLEKMFPQNGSSYPEIRFKGFTDPWEQRKLEDYLTVSAEKNTGNIYGRSDVLSVSGDYGIVNQIEFQGRSFAGASVSNYGVVQTGDVVYTKSPLNSNPYGIIKTNKGKPGIVSTLYAVYHPKENAFSDFIQVYFEQHARMNNYMHPLVNKGAKNDMKVSAENALKGPVCFPSRIEQESISAFFSVLDNLITLHQRKGKAAVSGCFLNCFSLEKSSAQSRTLELFGQISNQEIKYIIDGLSILGGKLRNFCVKLIILLSYTRINDIAKYHISRNTECVHNIN